jgi:hypothetical protein
MAALVRRHPAQATADPAAIARELAAKVDLVIHLTRFRQEGGRDHRVIQAVGFVTGQVEGEIPLVDDLCHYIRSRGEWDWTPTRVDELPLKIADKFEAAGVALAGILGAPRAVRLGP